MKVRKNFSKKSKQNQLVLQITQNFLKKKTLKMLRQMEKEKNLISKVRKNLKAETVDQKSLHLKNIIKKEDNFKTF